LRRIRAATRTLNQINPPTLTNAPIPPRPGSPALGETPAASPTSPSTGTRGPAESRRGAFWGVSGEGWPGVGRGWRVTEPVRWVRGGGRRPTAPHTPTGTPVSRRAASSRSAYRPRPPTTFGGTSVQTT